MASDITLEDDGIPWGNELVEEHDDKRWNRIGEQFSARPVAMQRSAAYRVLNNAERMMLDRIEIELASHGGNDNGTLPVTFSDFEEYGIRRMSIGPSRQALVALGFITFKQGRYSSPTRQDPNEFGLTYKILGRASKPGHRWRRLPNDIVECNHIAKEARKAES